MFHEGGCVSDTFANQISLLGRHSANVAWIQFVPIHFQEKSGVVYWTIALEQ
jgi:hypothetical protein